jgi:hypothetical protein
MQNKRGQDISITTIILVVLGIAVLVLLILGFTKGWNNIAPWLSGNNVDTIKTQCQASCATNSQYEFCTVNKSVNDGKLAKFDATCNTLALAKETNGYGIEVCPSITCK